jgi:excisionase family DNA binding protein
MTDARYDDELLTTSEVAAILRVDRKTVTGWARRGKLAFVLTPGGHRRYRKHDIDAMFVQVPHQRRASWLDRTDSGFF